MADGAGHDNTRGPNLLVKEEVGGDRCTVACVKSGWLARRRDDVESLIRSAIWRTIMSVLIGNRLYYGRSKVLRRVAWWALPHAGSWGMSPRAMDLSDRIKARTCEHNWRYDEEESAGPWTGYIERCIKCNALQQVPQ